MKEMFRMVDKSKVDEVKQMLEYTQKGTAKATVGNYMVVLRNDPLVRESMKYNKLTGRIDIVKKLWWNEEVCKLDDDGRTYFYYFFERYYKLTSEKCMDKALRIEANSRAYHPICEYLEQLEWDGQERIRYVLQRYMGADAGLIRLGRNYMRIVLLFTPFFMSNYTFTAFARNDHATSIAMIGSISGSFFNILFDYIFMFPLNLGFLGAALATALSPVVTMLVCSTHYLGKNNHVEFHWRKPSLRRIIGCCQLGVSAFFAEISSAVITIIFNMLILRIAGNIWIAAYGVVANISLVAMAILNGLAQGHSR